MPMSESIFNPIDLVERSPIKPNLFRGEPGERIDDDRQDAQPLAGSKLVVHEIHRPGLVRSRCRTPVISQLGLDPSLWRFVAQLQA